MNRRRFAERAPKNYAWVNSMMSSAAFDLGTVVSAEVIDGASIAAPVGVSIGSRARVANLKRIIMDATFGPENEEYDNVVDTYAWGPCVWMLILRDRDDLTIFDPDGTNWYEEAVLAHGVTQPHGLVIDVNAQAAGTGISSTFGHSFPPSVTVHHDTATNRRLGSNQLVSFHVARMASPTELVGPDDPSWFVHAKFRTLVQLP